MNVNAKDKKRKALYEPSDSEEEDDEDEENRHPVEEKKFEP